MVIGDRDLAQKITDDRDRDLAHKKNDRPNLWLKMCFIQFVWIWDSST